MLGTTSVNQVEFTRTVRKDFKDVTDEFSSDESDKWLNLVSKRLETKLTFRVFKVPYFYQLILHLCDSLGNMIMVEDLPNANNSVSSINDSVFPAIFGFMAYGFNEISSDSAKKLLLRSTSEKTMFTDYEVAINTIKNEKYYNKTEKYYKLVSGRKIGKIPKFNTFQELIYKMDVYGFPYNNPENDLA